VYNYVHMGNWRAFVFADTLRRAIRSSGHGLKSVMNITDVDDKTIHRSVQEKVELKDITRKYEQAFLSDGQELGIDLSDTKLVRATAEIEAMKQLILQLHDKGMAYVKEDGVYFMISAYQQKYPHEYGILSSLPQDAGKTHHRIDNDEYDKQDVRDFALWKKSDPGEPAWNLEIAGKTITGRPGWHIECSAMATKYLGQPFDVHTGGIDLVFPHHENEIAQSKAATGLDLAGIFVHNEHMMVDGKKMSKSLGNFYTLADVKQRGFHPLALRLLLLQSHYGSQQNFTWDALAAAQNFYLNIAAFADRQFQDTGGPDKALKQEFESTRSKILEALQDDLDTPRALAALSNLLIKTSDTKLYIVYLIEFLELLEACLGLRLTDKYRYDITLDQKKLIKERVRSRTKGDYKRSDQIRQQLSDAGLEILDTPSGPRWRRTTI
jgi:cysteinyl-tRNA synthetase